jgi:murein DD-endopeptidase MepM/ murein hydrolase activator NlpD
MIRDSTGVTVGQQVKVGDYIGRVGNTGTSTGAHLHFSILIDGEHVDPFKWLKDNTKGN